MEPWRLMDAEATVRVQELLPQPGLLMMPIAFTAMLYLATATRRNRSSTVQYRRYIRGSELR
jgi:hypothetical protein